MHHHTTFFKISFLLEFRGDDVVDLHGGDADDDFLDEDDLPGDDDVERFYYRHSLLEALLSKVFHGQDYGHHLLLPQLNYACFFGEMH